MKIIVSSKSFAEALATLPDISLVTQVELYEKRLTVKCIDNYSVSIPVETNTKYCCVNQYDVRWDWLKRDLRNIGEQSVTIEFDINKAVIHLYY